MEIENDLLSKPGELVTIRFNPKDTVVLESDWDYRSNTATFSANVEVPRKVEVLKEDGKWVPYPSVSNTVLLGRRVRVVFKDSDGKFKVGSSGGCFEDTKLILAALDAGVLVEGAYDGDLWTPGPFPRSPRG
jgi:hypothetical protein